MAYRFYVTIDGTKQGKFKGESTSAQHKDKIVGLLFSYEVISPRDLATGQASGKRQHKPITITKEWGAASPQIFQALVTNEILKTVLCEFVTTAPTGEEQVFYTIKLTNATVSDLKVRTLDTLQADQYEAHTLDEFSLTFQKIEIEDKLGKTMAMDSWRVGP